MKTQRLLSDDFVLRPSGRWRPDEFEFGSPVGPFFQKNGTVFFP